jgi:DNA-binding transcriptional ArsR family regulator
MITEPNAIGQGAMGQGATGQGAMGQGATGPGSKSTGGTGLQALLGALASPVRREILRLIWDTELPAGDIAAAFSLTKPTISQHLAVMRRAGLVSMRAEGTSRRYRARQDVARSVGAGLASAMKWEVANDLPERELSQAVTKYAVVASVEVETDQAATFRALADPEVYSRWLGAPVTLEDGRFACTLEWGTRVRGRYEVVSPPELIAMRWDFDDDNVPVPGAEMVGYLRLGPSAAPAGGCHVEVHQLVDTAEQAAFMEMAWRTVLGRLRAGVAAASGPNPMALRPRRPKRR